MSSQPGSSVVTPDLFRTVHRSRSGLYIKEHGIGGKLHCGIVTGGNFAHKHVIIAIFQIQRARETLVAEKHLPAVGDVTCGATIGTAGNGP